MKLLVGIIGVIVSLLITGFVVYIILSALNLIVPNTTSGFIVVLIISWLIHLTRGDMDNFSRLDKLEKKVYKKYNE